MVKFDTFAMITFCISIEYNTFKECTLAKTGNCTNAKKNYRANDMSNVISGKRNILRKFSAVQDNVAYIKTLNKHI